MSEQPLSNASHPVQKNSGPLGRSAPSACRTLTLLGLMAAAVAAVSIWFIIEPQYRAVAIVEIADEAPYFVFPDARERSSSRRFVETQRGLLKSVLVMGPVVSRAEIRQLPEVAELQDPISQLGEKVSFTSQGNSNLYDISYTGPNAENAAAIVRAVVDEYFKRRDEYSAERVSVIIRKLEDERMAHSQKVQRLRDSVREMTRGTPEAGQPFPGGETVADADVATTLTILRTRLIDHQVNQTVLQAELAALEEVGQRNPVEVMEKEVLEVLQERQEIQTLRERIAKNQQELREITSTSADAENDPRHKQLTAEIQRDEELLAMTREDLQEEIREEISARRELERAEEIERRQLNLDALAVLHGLLKEQLKDELARTTGVNIDNLELEFTRDEMVRAEKVFELISQRVETLQTEQRAPTQVLLLKNATPPKLPLGKYPSKQMALAGMLAFCLPFLIFGLSRVLGRPSPLEDPVFRRIWFDKPRRWRGEVSFPGEGEVGVAIAAPRKGPTDADRQVFLELRRRYADLKPSIANLLFDKYTIYQGEAVETGGEPEVPTLSRPEEIWGHTCLEAFAIEEGPNSSMPYLRLAYQFEWDESRLFFVYLWDWEVVRVEQVLMKVSRFDRN